MDLNIIGRLRYGRIVKKGRASMDDYAPVIEAMPNGDVTAKLLETGTETCRELRTLCIQDIAGADILSNIKRFTYHQLEDGLYVVHRQKDGLSHLTMRASLPHDNPENILLRLMYDIEVRERMP